MKLEINLDDCVIDSIWEGQSFSNYVRDCVQDAIHSEIRKQCKDLAGDPVVKRLVKTMRDAAVQKMVAEMSAGK